MGSEKQVTQLLNDFKPDVVHLNNIHTQVSPLIAKLAHEYGAKVVWTLHDTKLVCPCYPTMMASGARSALLQLGSGEAPLYAGKYPWSYRGLFGS